MNFQGSGGRSWHHFLIFLGCLFQDRFLIVLGSVLGSILEPFGFPNRVYVKGFGGSGLGSILGWFLGGSEILGALQVGGKFQGSGALHHQTDSWIQDPGSRIQTTGYRIQDT